MLCDIDCLPLRGRLQRLTYAAIFAETPISEVYVSVRRKDPTVADSNIARALTALKEKGFILEGEVLGKRVYSTDHALRQGDADAEAHSPITRIMASTDELRTLLYWYISRKGPKAKDWLQLRDADLVEIAGDIVDRNLPDAFASETFSAMEPLVKKLRSVMASIQGRSVPNILGLTGRQGDDREVVRIWPVRKQKRGQGWKVYVPYYASLWDEKLSEGNLSQLVCETVARMGKYDDVSPASEVSPVGS